MSLAPIYLYGSTFNTKEQTSTNDFELKNVKYQYDIEGQISNHQNEQFKKDMFTEDFYAIIPAFEGVAVNQEKSYSNSQVVTANEAL